MKNENDQKNIKIAQKILSIRKNIVFILFKRN